MLADQENAPAALLMPVPPVAVPQRRVLVISQEAISQQMAGPAIRAWWLARELARSHDVVLLVPTTVAIADIPSGVRIEVRATPSYRFMQKFVSHFDVVVSRPLRLHLERALARSGVRVIHDLYVPSPIEQLARLTDELDIPDCQRKLSYTRTRLENLAALTLADAILCASQRQRDLWIGALAAMGQVSVDDYARDPRLASRVIVVPFGLDPDPPQRIEPVLRGVVPGIDDESFLLLWAGGIWNWLDPLTVIEAVAQLADELPQLRLHFMGTRHPSPDVRMSMTNRAFELARKRGVLGTTVTFNEGWLPYHRRQGALLEADVGISAHFDSAEADYSFRTRLLDHLWSGLPTITTTGGPMSDVIRDTGAGIAVPPRDVEAWKEAIRGLAASPRRCTELAHGARHASADFTWPDVCQPLLRLIDEVTAQPGRSREARIGKLLPRYLWTQARIQIANHGARGVTRKLREAMGR